MSIGRDDFKRLRVPIALCLVLIAAGAAALASVENAIERAEKEQLTVRTAKLAAQDRVAKATDEEREIRENLAQFQRLVEWGIIGEEKRLDWVESIAQIRQQRKGITSSGFPRQAAADALLEGRQAEAAAGALGAAIAIEPHQTLPPQLGRQGLHQGPGIPPGQGVILGLAVAGRAHAPAASRAASRMRQLSHTPQGRSPPS